MKKVLVLVLLTLAGCIAVPVYDHDYYSYYGPYPYYYGPYPYGYWGPEVSVFFGSGFHGRGFHGGRGHFGGRR